MNEPLVNLEYFEVVDPHEMQPVETITGPVRIATAAWVGQVRLIDNIEAPEQTGGPQPESEPKSEPRT